MITQKHLKEILDYNTETGIWTWRVNQARRIKIGQRAGTIISDGHRHIGISGKFYKAHRLAWLYMTGEFPKDEIDHINGVPDDNRWCNLRTYICKQPTVLDSFDMD